MEKEKSTEKRKPLNNYLRFSTLGFQIVGSLGLGAWIGNKIDIYLGLKFPAFLIIFLLSALGGSLYLFIREVTKENQ